MPMRYAILCFTAEELSNANWTPGQDEAVIRQLDAVTAAFQGKVLQAARLLPTTSALSVRKGQPEPIITDGPFVESKEHFVGYYVVECETLELAVEFARSLMVANPWGSGYEIRPIRSLQPL